MKKIFLKILGYLLFCCVFSAMVLVIEFPYDRAKNYAERTVRNVHGVTLDIQKIGYAWPLGLYAENLRVSPPVSSSGDPFLKAKRIRFKFQPHSVLSGKISTSIQSDLFQGHMEGVLNLENVWSQEKSLSSRFQWTEIHLNTEPYLNELVPYFKLQSPIQGRAEFAGKFKQLSAMNGEGNFQCENIDITLNLPLVKIKPIQNLRAETRFQLKSGVLKFINGSFKASDLEGRLSGQIRLKESFSSSDLQLQGQLKIDPKLIDTSTLPGNALVTLRKQQALRFQITGSVHNPSFRLL